MDKTQTILIKNKEKEDFFGWLIGFIEGEGCFTFLSGSEKNQIVASFQLSLSIRDSDIIKKIHSKLGMGKIHYATQRQSKSIRIRVTKIKDIKKLINILDRFQFRTKKEHDYILWKKGVDIISKKLHLTNQGKEELDIIRNKMNKYNQDEFLNNSKVGGGSPQKGQMIRKHPLKPEELEKEFKDVNEVH